MLTHSQFAQLAEQAAAAAGLIVNTHVATSGPATWPYFDVLYFPLAWQLGQPCYSACGLPCPYLAIGAGLAAARRAQAITTAQVVAGLHLVQEHEASAAAHV